MPPHNITKMKCVVLGLMHTGTNVWFALKGCEDTYKAEGMSAECVKAIGNSNTWKHVPLAYRTISPSASCTVYVTQRNCTDYVKRTRREPYELRVTKDGIVRCFKPHQRWNDGVETARRNPSFADHLQKHPIPLMQMCTEQNQRAVDLERQGLLTVLHFDGIRNQTNRPIKDARNWVAGKNARKNARKAPRTKRLSPKPNLGSKLRVRAHTVIKQMQRTVGRKLAEMLEELRSEAAGFEESGTKK